LNTSGKVNPLDWETLIEEALKRRTALQAPPDFTRRVMRRVAEGPVSRFDGRATWLVELDAAATVLIVIGLAWSWTPARLGDWLDGGVNLLQRGGTALWMIAGVNPPAPLLLTALAVWVAGLLVSTWTELLD
jgi:hypothetical protein